jgi:RimJ/RimL family protein N-acetyltransferase
MELFSNINLSLKIINYNNKNLLNKIFEWRNDEKTRYYSNNSNIITYDIFEIIINKYKDSAINPLIIYLENVEVGIISFVKKDDKIYIGINIDNNFRNMKIGKNAIQYFIKNKNNFIDKKCKIYALVKNNNLSSINLFNNYFIFLNKDENFTTFYIDI